MGGQPRIIQCHSVLWVVCALLTAAPFSIEEAHAQVERLSVVFYRGYSFARADAEQLVSDINVMVTTDGFGSADVACTDLRYELSGEPSEAGRSLPKVVTSGNFAAFPRGQHKIHVVQAIYWCPNTPEGDRILGCAVEGGPILIARRREPANLYLHELGHAHGLSHHAARRNFMYKGVVSISTRKEAWQCDALKHGGDGISIAQLKDKTQDREGKAIPESGRAEKPSLEDLVSGLWPDGLPIDAVQELKEDQLFQIRAWISGDTYEYWPNSIKILGLRGNDTDVVLLQRVLNSKIDNNFVKSARINVPRALAYLVYRTKSEVAYEQLRQLLSPRANLRLMSGSVAEAEDDATLLALEATQGLAIAAASGLDKARSDLVEQTLKQKRGAVDLGVDDSFFDQARQLQRSLEERGLMETLRERQR